MTVDGEAAAGFNAVRLDNFQNANKGQMTYANDETGEVRYVDKTGAACQVTLGPRSIRIMRA